MENFIKVDDLGVPLIWGGKPTIFGNIHMNPIQINMVFLL